MKFSEWVALLTEAEDDFHSMVSSMEFHGTQSRYYMAMDQLFDHEQASIETLITYVVQKFPSRPIV